MNLAAAAELRSAGRQMSAATKNDRFKPVHDGAHAHFVKVGYMHTGNKMRAGISTSEYFKRRDGNSRTVSVQPDGSYIKMSRTARGVRRSRGKLDAKGMKCNDMEVPTKRHLMPMGNFAADKAGGDVDHLGEYQRLMKESAAHQRAADALAQSHADEDRPLYEQHAGKAWRLGNKAMDHFRRLTKEQRAMLRDQHWQNSKPMPAKGGFGQKKSFGQQMQSAARISLAEPEKILRQIRADWTKWNAEHPKDAAGTKGTMSKDDEDRLKENVDAIKGYGYKPTDVRSNSSTVYVHPSSGTVLMHDHYSGRWTGMDSSGNTFDSNKLAAADSNKADHSDFAKGWARASR